MRSGRLALVTLVSAVTVGVAAAEPASVPVPNLVGKPRTQAEAALADRGLLYKPRRPSSRYELPAGALGTGNSLTVVPEEQSPDRLATGQDATPGALARRGDRVSFSTSPRPAGHHRRPLPLEITSTALASDDRSLAVGLAPSQFADSCRPLDHVDVAPRAHFVIVAPYANVTDEAGACVRRARAVSLTLRHRTDGRPVVERAPVAPVANLFHVGPVRFDRVRLESAGRFAVVYFRPADGCGVYSHATVTPSGQNAALTVYTGTTSENASFCPLFRPRLLALVRIPEMLVGRPIVDGAAG